MEGMNTSFPHQPSQNLRSEKPLCSSGKALEIGLQATISTGPYYPIPELTDFRGFATLPLIKSDDMPKKPSNPDNQQIIPVETIQSRILLIRGHKVMLDADLAQLYQVSTGRLNEQVKRNRGRFPEDFMFELSKEELDNLKSQIATSSSWGGRRRSRPYAFTQEGVAMLSSVLRSKRAVQVNIAIMRAFVKLRELLATHKDLALKLDALEKKYDAQFQVVFDAIRKLMEPEELQYPCAFFSLFSHSFLPYLLSHTRKAQLCLLFSLSNLEKTVFTRFSSRHPLASKK